MANSPCAPGPATPLAAHHSRSRTTAPDEAYGCRRAAEADSVVDAARTFCRRRLAVGMVRFRFGGCPGFPARGAPAARAAAGRESTRLNSSHLGLSLVVL